MQPKIVLLTWWNESIAQLSKDNSGEITFVDNYDPDFSFKEFPLLDNFLIT